MFCGEAAVLAASLAAETGASYAPALPWHGHYGQCRRLSGRQLLPEHPRSCRAHLHTSATMLSCCREQWSYEKKIKKATARKERDLAERLASRRPTYRIDHLVKER